MAAPAALPPAPGPSSRLTTALWTAAAAFGTYFCMYAFRKPFTAAAYEETYGGVDFKTILVTAQVIGYTLSKFVGIRIVAEWPRGRRAAGIVILIAAAEAALVAFALVPRPWNALCLVANGLPLGMVFGLVLGCLEGRRETEALAAGLCASFILAGGVMKSVGAWLLSCGIGETWMPAAAGGLFLVPLVGFAALLARVPPPTAADEAARAPRAPLDRAGRRALAGRHATGLVLVVVVYTLVTILRSIRDDYAPELFRGLGAPAAPSAFARVDMWVAAGALVVSGAGVFLRDNRRAFFTALAWCLAGCLVLVATGIVARFVRLPAFAFMVTAGLGLSIPYVVIHTTVFERLLAATRDVGNIGFLMQVADAFGYLGYVAVMLGRGWLGSRDPEALAGFFVGACTVCGAAGAVALLAAAAAFATTLPGRDDRPPAAHA